MLVVHFVLYTALSFGCVVAVVWSHAGDDHIMAVLGLKLNVHAFICDAEIWNNLLSTGLVAANFCEHIDNVR